MSGIRVQRLGKNTETLGQDVR